jgi:flagellar hook-length control protein FliK
MAASAVAAQAGAIAGQTAASAGQVQTQVPAAIPAPPAQIVNQVQSAIVNNLGQGTQQLTLSLTPESLGTLNVVLTVKGKEVQALIKADTPDATKVISENLSQIKQSLESQGLTVSKMEVQTNLAQDSTLGQQWSGAEQHNQAQERRDGLDRMRNTALLNQDNGLAQDMQTTGVQENFTRSGLNVIA